MNCLLDCLCITIDAHKELIFTQLVQKNFLDSNLFLQGSTVPRFYHGARKEDKLEENPKDPQAEELLGD